MSWTLQLTGRAARDLKRLDKAQAGLIVRALRKLLDELNHPELPALSDVKKMQGSPDHWRLRVGDYRVVFRKEADTLVLLVLYTGHRREVYQR